MEKFEGMFEDLDVNTQVELNVFYCSIFLLFNITSLKEVLD